MSQPVGTPPGPRPRHNRIQINFPLRPGVNITFRNLPADMTVAEANRIAAMLLTLVAPKENV